MRPLSDAELLRELEPVVARNLDRHLATVKEWMPHEYVPWSRGRDFAGENGAAWTSQDSTLSEAAQAALSLNLLTEDNLPSYHHELLARVGSAGAWGAWVRRWSAEEARHARSLRDYVLLSRAMDPAALERDSMATLQLGWVAEGKDLLRSIAYATLQELATRVAHRNTGLAVQDPTAERLLRRIAADENLHMVFYRDLVTEAFALVPDQMLAAIAQEVARFEMPGAGLPGFHRKSVLMADAGIYDVRLHRDEVVLPLLRHWHALTISVASPAAQEAQHELSQHLDQLEAIAKHYEQRRMRRKNSSPPEVPTSS